MWSGWPTGKTSEWNIGSGPLCSMMGKAISHNACGCDNPLLMEDIMLLQLDVNDKNETYTVVSDLAPFAKILHNTLGVNTSVH